MNTPLTPSSMKHLSSSNHLSCFRKTLTAIILSVKECTLNPEYLSPVSRNNLRKVNAHNELLHLFSNPYEKLAASLQPPWKLSIE